MPITKEKTKQIPKVKSKETAKDKQKEKQTEKQNFNPKEKKLTARADYRPEGWFAVVGYEGLNEDVFAQLAANEVSAYEAAIAEIQRIKIVDEGVVPRAPEPL
jgi:hypothetical protein